MRCSPPKGVGGTLRLRSRRACCVHTSRRAPHCEKVLRTRHRCQASPAPDDLPIDLNQLQTRLNTAVVAEDYALAATIKRRIVEVSETSGNSDGGPPPAASWTDLGVPPWLAERAEQLGFLLPTDIQRRALQPMALGADVLIKSQTGSGKTLAFVMPALSMLQYPPELYPDDLKGPQAVIVVPHRDLGVQITLLVFKLFGGNVSSGTPGDAGNMFAYKGPRGLSVRGCLDKEEVLRAKNARYLNGCHVVVGTPECLAECISEPSALSVMQHAQVVVVDEADDCLAAHGASLKKILGAACEQAERPTFAFAGATLDDAFAQAAAELGWLSYPVHVESPGPGQLPPALKHRFVVVPEGMADASVLTKLLRTDLKAEGLDAPAPRVMAFAASEERANALANPLRNTLWEEHRIGLLLPSGEQPTKTLHDFRDFKTSMLLMTPAAARGLDLPAVSHVYNLGLPSGPKEYLHRAGRAGRTGSDVTGTVTTIVTEGEVPELVRMVRDLGVTASEVELTGLRGLGRADGASSEADHAGYSSDDEQDGLDSSRKALEDLFNLY